MTTLDQVKAMEQAGSVDPLWVMIEVMADAATQLRGYANLEKVDTIWWNPTVLGASQGGRLKTTVGRGSGWIADRWATTRRRVW